MLCVRGETWGCGAGWGSFGWGLEGRFEEGEGFEGGERGCSGSLLVEVGEGAGMVCGIGMVEYSLVEMKRSFADSELGRKWVEVERRLFGGGMLVGLERERDASDGLESGRARCGGLDILVRGSMKGVFVEERQLWSDHGLGCDYELRWRCEERWRRSGVSIAGLTVASGKDIVGWRRIGSLGMSADSERMDLGS